MLATSGHKPFDTRIFHKEALSLHQNGFKVSIIIPHEKDLTQEGIDIISVPSPPNGYQKLLITPLLVFFKALRQNRKAVYHVHDSELLFISLLLKLLGRKVIYDAHEDTPLQIEYQHWLPGWLKWPYKWFYYWLEKLCGKIFTAVIVAEPIIARYFPPNTTTLVRNFPIYQTFQRIPIPPYVQRKNWLIYTGLISEVRGVKQMIGAVKKAREKQDFEFMVVGFFAPKHLEHEVLAHQEVNYTPWLPYNEMLKQLFQSKIGIIIPNPVKRYNTNYPVKMFEYMAAGLPVIGSKHAEAAKFIRECQGGILVDPLDEQEISLAIVELFSNSQRAQAMGERARKMISEKYNWEQESQKLLSLYDRLL